MLHSHITKSIAVHLSILYFSLHLTIEKYNFLGISIVGQSNEKGDGGIYIGSIMKGGAVAADGRIEPGDMLLQVCFDCLFYTVRYSWSWWLFVISKSCLFCCRWTISTLRTWIMMMQWGCYERLSINLGKMWTLWCPVLSLWTKWDLYQHWCFFFVYVHIYRPITLTVAKCWDPNPRSCFTLPRSKRATALQCY